MHDPTLKKLISTKITTYRGHVASHFVVVIGGGVLLLLTAILPRFHGTYQVYFDRAVKGHHSGTSDYDTTITTATTAFMEPTRSTLTVQFGPVGSRCDPFRACRGQKRSKRVTTAVCQ